MNEQIHKRHKEPQHGEKQSDIELKIIIHFVISRMLGSMMANILREYGM